MGQGFGRVANNTKGVVNTPTHRAARRLGRLRLWNMSGRLRGRVDASPQPRSSGKKLAAKSRPFWEIQEERRLKREEGGDADLNA